MAATYNPIIQEKSADLTSLASNNYNLQVAKAVSSPGGTPTFNVVYTSKMLGPTMSVSWQTLYGLNWSTEIPDAGALVEYTGNWQACAPGASYDLNNVGEWVANDNDPNANANSLNVGVNGYEVPVNIIVGVMDPDTLTWTPIFVDPNKLLVKGHGSYEPRESVQIWYQEGNLTATMIEEQALPSETFDMTGINKYYFYYDTNGGKWWQQATAFPQGQVGVDLPSRRASKNIPVWVPPKPSSGDMPKVDDIIAIVSQWAINNFANIQQIYLQKGGWEGWAQVEIALLLTQAYPNTSTVREVYCYTDDNKRADLVLSLKGEVTQVVELKMESLYQDSQKGGKTNFLNAMKADINKIDTNILKPAYRPANLFAIGLTCQDEISDYLLTPGVWNPYTSVASRKLVDSTPNTSALYLWIAAVFQPAQGSRGKKQLRIA